MEKETKEEISNPDGEISEEKNTEEETKKENKIFRGILITMIGFVLMFGAFYFIIHSTNNFSYEGVTFAIDKTAMTGRAVYRTSLPVVYNGTNTNYNFYLRGDPRALKNINFTGDLVLEKNVVLNMTNDFNCNGDGIIAIANLQNLYNVIGSSIIRDENASCDSKGRYMFVKIREGNETRIEQFGFSCYNIYVKNCEILPATERFMVETLSKVNQALKNP